MVYTVGISSGIWIRGAQDAENYAGLSKKIYASIRYGVNFVQLDIQQLTEFLEPGLEAEIKKITDSGFSFGIHGECSSFGSPIALDSSIETEYMMAHQKTEKHIEEATKHGSQYVLLHSSESTPFPLALAGGGTFKDVRLVDPWGNKLNEFLEKNPNVLNWAIDYRFFNEYIFNRKMNSLDYYIRKETESFIQSKQKEPTPEENKKIQKEAKERYITDKKITLKDYSVSGDTFYLPDRISYPIIAKWMEMNRHPLWKKYVGRKTFDEVEDNIEIWVPAVTAMYTAGHFESKCKLGSLKESIERNRMLLVFETPMPPQSGYELYMRLPRLIQIYNMVTYIDSDYIGMAVDFEHLLTSNLDPIKEIKALPSDAGKKIKVIHAGAPVPYATAHMAIDIGSDAQKYIYDRLWELRQKGFTDGYIIYERAGEEGIRTSILSLRLIKEYLEKEIAPKDLPLAFFGVSKEGPEIKRQQLQVREHSLDPLKGLLSVPEEEYGFLGSHAIKKGKGDVWKTEEYR